MAKLTSTQEKYAIIIAMGILAYSQLSAQFVKLPALPAIFNKELLMGITLMTVAAGIVLYGVYVFSKY